MVGVTRSRSSSRPTGDLSPPEIAQLRQRTVAGFQEFFRNVSTSPAQFDTDVSRFTIGQSQGERDALEGIRGAAGASDAEVAAQDNLRRTLRGEFRDPNSGFLRSAIEAAQRSVREQFGSEQDALRAVATQSGQAVQSSSPFAVALGDLQTGFLDALGDTAARVAVPIFEGERNREIQAASLSTQLQAALLERQERLADAEALPREIREAGLDRALSEQANRRQSVAAALASAAGLSAPIFGQNSSSRSNGFNIL